MTEETIWLEAVENEEGVKTLTIKEDCFGLNQINGYNGIEKGDLISYKGTNYTVVMVSRLGHFGLSTTGELPYELCARPDEVKKV